MVVNQEGEIVTENDTQTPKGESISIGSGEPIPSNGVIDEPQPLSKEHEAFINYTKRIRKITELPKPSDDDFCRKMKEFIETRGDGMASSDQLIEAYNLFQSTCIEKKKDDVEEQAEKSQEAEAKKEEIENQEEMVSKLNAENQVDQVPAIADEYKHRDSKLTTFDDDLGIRPNANKVIKKIPEVVEKTNNNSLLFFLVILGVATMAYAITKKD
jgi:hypothetical protein